MHWPTTLISNVCGVLPVVNPGDNYIAVMLGVKESVRETQVISLVDACVIALLMQPNYISFI